MAFRSLPDANDDLGEVDNIMSQLQEDWYDCTNDKDLDEVRHISDKPLTTLDEAMICDIQRVVARLAEKAPQLIGKYNLRRLCMLYEIFM